MKLFGWGKSKDSQPQGRQQISKSDSRSGSYGLDRSSAMGPVMPGKGSGTSMRKQQGLFDSKDPSSVDAEAETEEKLQSDNIRFVFSHEREGLLAIGTFALEQLQSIRNTIDGHQKGAPDPAAAAADNERSAINLLALDEDVMQSSDDEDQLQRSWLAARQVCDLPVFGDALDDAAADSDNEQAPSPSPAAQNSSGVQQDECRALTIYKGNPNVNPPAERTPVIILAPELQSVLKQPFLPHWTDSVPLPLIGNVNEPGPFADNDYYSTRLCGLFNKTSPRSKRMPLVPAATGEDGNRIIPIEKASMLESKKSSFLNFAAQGGAMPSLRKLAKLWKSSCTSSSARIAPERNTSPQRTPQVPPPSGPRGAEGRRRVQAHERMVVDNQGHWIKDDEDFVVLEM